jgi:TonB family protein
MAVDTSVTTQDEQHRKRGMMVSVALHVALIMLALLPLLTFPDPPPGQEGILVNLGMPDEGQGTDNAGPSAPIAEDLPDDPQPEDAAPPEEVAPPEPEPDRNVVTSDDSDVQVKKNEKKKEEDRKRQERLEQERREREAREEAQRKEAAEKARRDKEASDLKDLLKGGLEGDGDGKGNTGKPGNQGDPNGDPNSDILEGISTGSGRVGGGLGDRGVSRTHKPTDDSQEQGVVVVKVCVDKAGNVISAEFTQRGSTVTTARLKNIAISSAKKWKFSPGQVDRQCGTITYNFKAQ